MKLPEHSELIVVGGGPAGNGRRSALGKGSARE